MREVSDTLPSGRRGRKRRPHLHRAARYDDLLQTLHEMDGFAIGSQPEVGTGPLRAASLTGLRARVEAFGNPPREFTSADGSLGEGSFLKEILGSNGCYDGDQSTAVALDPSLLSLPASCAPVDPFGTSGSMSVELHL